MENFRRMEIEKRETIGVLTIDEIKHKRGGNKIKSHDSTDV